MDLTHFPMDSQLCTLEIESYGYTMADLSYTWKEGKHSVEVGTVATLFERQHWSFTLKPTSCDELL